MLQNAHLDSGIYHMNVTAYCKCYTSTKVIINQGSFVCLGRRMLSSDNVCTHVKLFVLTTENQLHVCFHLAVNANINCNSLRKLLRTK